MKLRQQGSNSLKIPAYLGLSGMLLLWSATDLLVLGWSESSGAGGNLSVVHRNWYRRYVKNNSLGFWSVEPPVGERQRPLLAIVGDSFTWGQGVASEQRYTDEIQRRLGSRATVLNFGRGGASTRSQLQEILPAVASVKPDIVLLGYLANDIHDGLRWYKTVDHDFTPWQIRWLVWSPTLNFVQWRFLNPAGSRSSHYTASLLANYQEDRVFSEHAQDLQAWSRSVRAMGAQPLAAVLPFPYLWAGVEPQVRGKTYARIHLALRDAGFRTLALEDMERRYSRFEFDVSPADSHPSPRVHLEMGRRLSDWLEGLPELRP